MAEPPSSTLQTFPKFTELNDLVNEKVGGKILYATDDWFAVAENLLKAEDPVFKVGVFTKYGKWMDGWETRRKRIPGHDWCIIELGVPGVISGIDVDTSYFTGNYSPQVSIQAAVLSRAAVESIPKRKSKMGTATTMQMSDQIQKLKSEDWKELVPRRPLNPGYKTSCHNFFEVNSNERWTHLRVNMFPDGGIARLRVYGRAIPDWSKVSKNSIIDLAAMENGGMCLGYSNVHFGHARNLIQPGRAETMADGWETARKPDRPAILEANEEGILQVPGDDWCVFRLGHPGIITKVLIDTNHFKGNYPDSCRIEACNITEDEEEAAMKDMNGGPWKILLPPKKLYAHQEHEFGRQSINNCGVVNHVRLTMAPDGGISRMRLFGYIQDPDDPEGSVLPGIEDIESGTQESDEPQKKKKKTK
ncbi:allantoicase-like isoform X1 [Crassostrea angulata]|uniref:allantoicase-like isoform X1 n=1 Tax=Magallana angulata TaxID=2784310 RepID=UPI0022B13563|nr:allantoicase-like isoform X1 [Crassostrea angulata]